MNFEIVPAYDIPPANQATIFNRAFAGYLAGWTDMDGATLARFICAQGADLFYSRFVRSNGMPVGFGYINRTGDVPRLAGMGTVPEVRRTGAAAYLLSHLLEEAKTRGDKAMVLEVFEQNEGALRLYQRFGFQMLPQLFGWRRKADIAPPGGSTAKLEETSIIQAIRTPSKQEYPEIPWQISRHAIAKLPRARAFRIGDVCIVIGDPEVSPIRVHAFFYVDHNEKIARTVFESILQKFPNREFFAPALFPGQFREIFESLGFTQEPLNQILMRRDL